MTGFTMVECNQIIWMTDHKVQNGTTVTCIISTSVLKLDHYQYVTQTVADRLDWQKKGIKPYSKHHKTYNEYRR